jgi:hypothetical protein
MHTLSPSVSCFMYFQDSLVYSCTYMSVYFLRSHLVPHRFLSTLLNPSHSTRVNVYVSPDFQAPCVNGLLVASTTAVEGIT